MFGARPPPQAVTLPHDAMIGLERSAIGNGHPIYARQIAWLPVCVLFLFAPPT
jgi:hypothetical protein